MHRIGKCWPFLLALMLGNPGAGAASLTEQRAFFAARNLYDFGFWERAEQEFGAFAAAFPNSEFRAEAVLRQAQAAYRQTNSAGAFTLLSANLNQAGKFADEYQFWIAEAQFENSNYLAAAEAYARLIRDFTNSTRVLEASYDEALSRSKLGDWPRVIELLGRPEGTFQRESRRNPNDEIVARGLLMLGGVYFEQKNFRAAEDAMQLLAQRELDPGLDWRRQYLLCRVLRAAGRLAEASHGTTNLLALAATTGRKELLAESAVFQAGIFEQLKQPAEAIVAHESLLAEGMPQEYRRQALLKIIELTLAQNREADALQRLERFLRQYPNDPSADVALMALGELYLKAQSGASTSNPLPNPPPATGNDTNSPPPALVQFDLLVKNFPQSPLAGKAQLNRGWCLLSAGRIAESEAAFQMAAERLPLSEDQAVARFKWADCQFQRKDYGGALTNYRAVVENYVSFAEVRGRLFEPGLYQIVRASLDLGDLLAATNALARILSEYPDSFLCDRSMLLVGQQMKDPASARKVYTEALQRFPVSILAPEIELAIARTYEQEAAWPAAIAVYDGWLTNFAGHEARPRVEFNRAWANYQAGNETNALALFMGFIAQFPTNEQQAPVAQNWVADHFYAARDYQSAELNYRLLFQKWPASPLAPSAYLMAGRAAFARDEWNAAVEYFTNLTGNLMYPPDLVAQALLLYGDTVTRMPPDTNNPATNFWQAIRIYNKIPQLYPTNDLVPKALGRIGDCHLQIGQDPLQYESASNAYRQVIEWPRADAATRSMAGVGMGLALKEQARTLEGPERTLLLKQAMDRYLDVMRGTNLREGEQADPFWTKVAGLAAAKLAEELQQWEQAVKLYQKLAEWLPPLRAGMESKIANAQKHLAPKKE